MNISDENKVNLFFMKALMNEEELTKCPHCGASLKQYWHSLTPILVRCLVKMRKRVSETGINQVHLQTELNLTKNEYNNFQKLRFHAMIAKVKNHDGTHRNGYWLLTTRGAQFLNNEIEVPKRVKTFRNSIVDKDTEMVKVIDVISQQEYLETIETIDYDYAKLDQTSLF